MTSALVSIGYVSLGLAMGSLYFYLLHRSLRPQASGPGPLGFMLYALVRLSIAAGGFWWIAQHGALPVLLALGGFIAARFAAFHVLRYE